MTTADMIKAIIGVVALLVLARAALIAKMNTFEKPEGDDDLDFIHCVDGDER
jgi:hypothetical protein